MNIFETALIAIDQFRREHHDREPKEIIFNMDDYNVIIRTHQELIGPIVIDHPPFAGLKVLRTPDLERGEVRVI